MAWHSGLKGGGHCNPLRLQGALHVPPGGSVASADHPPPLSTPVAYGVLCLGLPSSHVLTLPLPHPQQTSSREQCLQALRGP